jgi:uncharacterized membrane protein HdeD (DUF308 family)
MSRLHAAGYLMIAGALVMLSGSLFDSVIVMVIGTVILVTGIVRLPKIER